MTKYTFEMYIDVTEQTTVEAESYEEARALLDSGDCEWEEVSSEGGELALVSQSLPRSKINPTPFIERLKDAYYNPVTGDNINDNGVAITYANKDELTAEDIESAGADE